MSSVSVWGRDYYATDVNYVTDLCLPVAELRTVGEFPQATVVVTLILV